MSTRMLLCLALACCPGGRAAAQAAGDLFEAVVATLATDYWDRGFRSRELPLLAAGFRAAATQATTLAEECAVIHGLLAYVPSSHLALYSKSSYLGMMAELAGRERWTLGFQLEQRASRFFACRILEGGPADRVGLRRGDCVLSIDGRPPQTSPRLGRRTDDAHLPDAPMHAVEVGGSGAEVVRLVVERRPGAQLALPLESARYSALRAARHSGRVEVRGGKRIGYLHLLYIHAGCVGLLREFAGARFADCDALVLDLRGRGGSAAEARRILRFFCGPRRVWHRPFAVLMDRGSRSAKEMLAYEFKRRAAAPIIGERSAGALVPATFREVGQGLVLMFPARRIAKYSDAVELVGVEPDIAVDHPLPYAAGADPVLQRALQHLAGSRRAARLRFPGASVRRSRPR